MKNTNKNSPVLYASIIVYFMAVAFILRRDNIYTCGLALGSALVLYAMTNELPASLLLGSLVGVVAAYYNKQEGFANEDESKEEDGDHFEDVEEEKPKKKAAKKKVTPPPDNDTRKEFLGLGKKYKAPSEDDDKDFHLDAGTTFMNAYKSLKPDQVAAMTKDTQDLMQTQKQLMSTLHTLKPLIKDGKEMMNMFQSYFGAGEPTTA